MLTWLKILEIIWKPLLGAILHLKGRSDAKRNAALDQAESYISTRKAIDDALLDTPHSVDAARGWLRERGSESNSNL